MDRLCVYCGSRPGRSATVQDAARAFGQELVRRDIDLVYGGGGIGLMNTLAQSVLEAGGEVTGVIPEGLLSVEAPPAGLTDLRTVDTMHQRKHQMFELSDGFVALPGGFGTLDELFEMLTWSQLGIHDHPCGLLNVEGYYDGLLAWVEEAIDQGFATEPHRQLLVVEDDPRALLDGFERYEPPERDKTLQFDQV